jgi:hypothetical protein
VAGTELPARSFPNHKNLNELQHPPLIYKLQLPSQCLINKLQLLVIQISSSAAEPGSESRGADIELLSGAGAEITNCGSSSGSILFTTNLKKLYLKDNFQDIFLKNLEPGLKPEPELKFGFAAPWSRSRKEYFRLRNTDH